MIFAWFCGETTGITCLYALTIVFDYPAGETQCVWETAASRQLRQDEATEHWSYGIPGGYCDEFMEQFEGYGTIEDARELPKLYGSEPPG